MKCKLILTRDQKKKIIFKNESFDGQKVDLIITLRYDDHCGNGHNTFSITGDMYEAGKRSDRAIMCCGCLHDEIKQIAPKFSKYIKWHLMSSDKPMHYVANTMYHASKVDKLDYFVYLIDEELKINKLLKLCDNLNDVNKIISKYGIDNIKVEEKPNSMNKEIDLEAARSTALAPFATLEQLQSKDWLKARIPTLRKEFKKAMEEIGFTY